MLKTYRIIPFTLILCLFGFTLITVSPVFAQAPEANELRTGFADHTQNEVAENKCNHETKKCPNKQPTT